MPVITRSQSATLQANSAVDRMTIIAARHGFHREYINQFLIDPIGPSETSLDGINVDNVRPLSCVGRRGLYGISEKVAAAFYHPRGFDLGSAPQFRGESNQPLEVAAALILSQVESVADLSAGDKVDAATIHDAWVHAWLVTRRFAPQHLADGNAYVRPYSCVNNRFKLVEPIFIAMAYRMILNNPDASTEEVAETCMDLATTALRKQIPEAF